LVRLHSSPLLSLSPQNNYISDDMAGATIGPRLVMQTVSRRTASNEKDGPVTG